MGRFLSEHALEAELQYTYEHYPIDFFIEHANDMIDINYLTEEEYNKVTQHLRLDILDIDKFVKVNALRCCTSPRLNERAGIPASDGILSNTIFGTTMEERAGIFAYIDLHDWFIDPSCYKTWVKLDKKVKNCVHGVQTYIIDKEGNLIADPNGETGIKFLKKNIDKIRFRRTDSISRDISVDYLEANKDRMFINKYLVIPPFYRDQNNRSKAQGVGGVNELYVNLIKNANALQDTQEYGFDTGDAQRGRIQENLMTLYDWFCGNTNANIDKSVGAGISGKMGILRRSNMAKTANFSARLVISAPELKAKDADSMIVDMDHSSVPLYALMAEFRDFVMFHTKRFFENEFIGNSAYPVMNAQGKLSYVVPDSPEIEFSDERIKTEMDRFLHGYNNRFIPIEIPVKNSNDTYYMAYKGRGNMPKDIEDDPNPIYHRRLTWCDVFYIATVKATVDKHVLITRFPIDSFSNQFTLKVKVASTKDTEPIYYDDDFYPDYPKIREEDILTDTSNKFIDTLRFSNCYLKGCGGDYDGDQVTCKGVYTREANDELETFMNSKENLVGFGANPLRYPGDDCIQAMYALTKVLSTVSPTKSESISYKKASRT